MRRARRQSVPLAVLLVLAGGPAAGAAAVGGQPGPDEPVPVGDAATGRTVQSAAGDAVVSDGGTYWIGQVLYSDAFSADAEVELRRGSPEDDRGLVTPVAVDADGELLVATATMVPDTYTLTATGGPTITFRLRSQTYSATATPTTVTNGSRNARSEITVTSNRRRYAYAVTSPRLDAAALDRLLDVDGVHRDTNGDGTAEALVVSGTGTERTLTADFGGVEPGAYRLDFAVVDAAATAGVAVTVESAAAESADLARNVLTEEQGDVVAVPVEFTNATRAAITIGSEDAGYRAAAVVTDGDGDGRATVLFDTYTAGDRSRGAARVVRTVDGDDSVELRSRTELAAILDVGSYDVTVRAGSDPGTDPEGLGVVSLVDRSTGRSQVWTAAGARSIGTVDGITGGIDDGSIVANSTVDLDATGADTVIVAVEVSGIDGLVADEGSVAGAIEAGKIDVAIEQTNPGPARQPKVVDPTGPGVSYVRDAANDVLYVVVDGRNVTASPAGGGRSGGLAAGDRFAVEFVVPGGTALNPTPGDETSGTTFTVVDRSDDDPTLDVLRSTLREDPGVIADSPAPDRITSRLGGVRIDVHVENEGTVGVVTDDDGVVSSVERGGVDDARYRIVVPQSVARGIVDADDPVERAVSAYETGDVTVKPGSGVTGIDRTITRIQLAVGRFLLGVL
jgi:hypothetical protein